MRTYTYTIGMQISRFRSQLAFFVVCHACLYQAPTSSHLQLIFAAFLPLHNKPWNAICPTAFWDQFGFNLFLKIVMFGDKSMMIAFWEENKFFIFIDFGIWLKKTMACQKCVIHHSLKFSQSLCILLKKCGLANKKGEISPNFHKFSYQLIWVSY